MFFRDKHDFTTTPKEKVLIKNLIKVFHEEFQNFKHFHVSGILSYSMDKQTEKFLKIDFSSVNSNSSVEDSAEPESFLKSRKKTFLDYCSDDQTTNLATDQPISRSGSPPLLPPLVLQCHKLLRGSLHDTPSTDGETLVEDSAINDEASSNHNRRDRRKCRKPKRQLINPDAHSNKDLVEEDMFEESTEKWDADGGKKMRLSINGENVELTQMRDSVYTTKSDSLCIPTCDSLAALISSPITTSLSTSQGKVAVSTKSLGLGDLSEVCGLLLGRPFLQNDMPQHALKLSNITTNSSNPVILAGNDAINQVCSSISTQSLPVSTNSTQSIALNPTLAAAVAAALSNSLTGSSTIGSSLNCGLVNSAQGISINTPTIALTGPNGELLGTIPICASNLSQNVVSSPNFLSQSSNPCSNFNANNSSISINQQTFGNSSQLINTLNLLRGAVVTNESTQNLAPVVSGSTLSLCGNDAAAVLQSLTNQSATSVISSKPQSINSISVGPTLALIGTVGLNSTTTPSISNSPLNSGIICSASPVSNVTQQTIGLNQNPLSNSSISNNAALIAAILRGLTNIKQNHLEPSDLPADINQNSLPSSMALVTNAVRSNLNSTDTSFGSLNNIIASRTGTSQPQVSTNMDPTNPLLAAVLNRGGVLTSNTNTSHPRSSIMFSYPRGQGEMNVLFSAPSGQPFATPGIPSISALPTPVAFQNFASAQTANTVINPLTVQTCPVVTSAVSPLTTVVSATSTVSSTVSIVSSPEQTSLSKVNKSIPNSSSIARTTSNESCKAAETPDSTASAIDRILQTIKGCMSSNENRENEVKLKLHSLSPRRQDQSHTTASKLQTGANTLDESKKKLVPVTFSLNRGSSLLNNINSPLSHKSSDLTKVSMDRTQSSTKELDDSESPFNTALNKTYRCRYCGKTFNRKFCRERHERLHTGVKPYTCEICDEKFIRLEDKKRHVRSLQHYLSGRAAYMNAELSAYAEAPSRIEPSSVLPLLAQTLQNGEQKKQEDGYTDVEIDAGEVDASDEASHEHGSDCELYEGEGALEKTPTSDETGDEKCQVDASDSPESAQGERLDTMSSEVTSGSGGIKLTISKARTRSRSALKEAQSESNGASDLALSIPTKVTHVIGEADCVS